MNEKQIPDELSVGDGENKTTVTYKDDNKALDEDVDQILSLQKAAKVIEARLRVKELLEEPNRIISEKLPTKK